jgi:hypothetical protein
MRLQTISALFAAVVLCGGPTVAHAGGRPQADAKPDPTAFALLQEAHDRRDTLPAGFSGLTADVALNDNGKELKGTLTYTSAGDVKLALQDATKDEEEWAHEQLSSALAHRRKDDFAHGDGGHPLTLVQDDHSPLGRLIALNDRFKSMYRVKDGQITEVTRSMGNMKFTITILDNRFVEGGKYLPNHFVVTYFDGTTGAIQHVDEFSDDFVKVGKAWIPSARRVVTAENGGFTTHVLALTNIHLLGTTAAAKR